MTPSLSITQRHRLFLLLLVPLTAFRRMPKFLLLHPNRSTSLHTELACRAMNHLHLTLVNLLRRIHSRPSTRRILKMRRPPLPPTLPFLAMSNSGTCTRTNVAKAQPRLDSGPSCRNPRPSRIRERQGCLPSAPQLESLNDQRKTMTFICMRMQWNHQLHVLT